MVIIKKSVKENAYPWAHTLFEVFLAKYDFHKKYNVEGYERIYCNAHTHGLEPHIHSDDGDFHIDILSTNGLGNRMGRRYSNI